MRKAILYIVAGLLIMVAASVVASVISAPLSEVVPGGALSYAVNGIVYVAVSVGLVILLLWSRKRQGQEPFLTQKEIGLCKPRSVMTWTLVALILPALVSAYYLLFLEGTLIRNVAPEGISETQHIAGQISFAVFSAGLGAGIVEEMVFRGVIMASIERVSSRKVAVFVPSVLFGLVHLLNLNTFDIISVALLLAGGTMVGIMFSLIRTQSGSIFAGAIVHGVWNMIIIGGILDIGKKPWDAAIYQYILSADSMLITGGEFGIEVALPAIIGYIVVTCFALYLRHDKKQTHQQIRI